MDTGAGIFVEDSRQHSKILLLGKRKGFSLTETNQCEVSWECKSVSWFPPVQRRNTKPADRVLQDGIHVFGTAVQCLQANYYLSKGGQTAALIELTYNSLPCMLKATSEHASPLPWFVLSKNAPDSWRIAECSLKVIGSCMQHPWADYVAGLQSLRSSGRDNQFPCCFDQTALAKTFFRN